MSSQNDMRRWSLGHHNVVLDKSFGAPRVTTDGVTVAMGEQIVREVASKTFEQISIEINCAALIQINDAAKVAVDG